MKKVITLILLLGVLYSNSSFADAKAEFIANCGLMTRYKATAKIRKPTGTFPWTTWVDKGCSWAEETRTDMDVSYPSNTGGNAFAHAKKAAGVFIQDYNYKNNWSAGEPWEKLNDEYAYIPVETETPDAVNLDIFSSAKVTGNDEDIDKDNNSLTLKNIKGELFISGKDFLQGNVTFYLEVRQFSMLTKDIDINRLEDWGELNTEVLFYSGAVHIIGGKMVTEGNFTEDMFILTEGENQVKLEINIEKILVNFKSDKLIDYDRIMVSTGVDGDLIGNGASKRYAVKNPNNISLQELVSDIQSNSKVNFNLSKISENGVQLNFTKIDLSKSAQLNLYDLNGKLIRTENLTNLSSNKIINISELASGVYFVKIKQDDKLYSKKFIK